MIMTDYEAYKMYLALKAHFQTDYDVIKMQGRIRASRKAYTSNKELIFKRLVKKYDDATICNFMVSNFISGNHWGGVFDEQSQVIFQEWQRRTQSLRYNFEQDLQTLKEEFEEEDHGDDWFTPRWAGQHPLILKAFLRRSISPETLVILNRIVGFTDKINLPRDPVWPDIKRMIEKYQPFLRVDISLYKELYERAVGKEST